MSIREELAELFDINTAALSEYPNVIAKQAFCARLQQLGIDASDDAHADRLIQAAMVLEEKLAAIRTVKAASSPLNVALGLLLNDTTTKQASVGDDQDRSSASAAILRSMLQDAPTFAAGLTYMQD